MESRNVDVAIVDTIEIRDYVDVCVGLHSLLEVGVLLLCHLEQDLPLVLHLGFLFLDQLGVLDSHVQFVSVLTLQRLVKGHRVYLLNYRLQCIQRFLQNFVPVRLGHMADYWHHQRECV